MVAANGDIFVADVRNHAIRVIMPQGAVRTLCGNGQSDYADTQGADAHFKQPCGVALDVEENLLVADWGNNAIRRVMMTGAVSTWFADGPGAAARFDGPCDLVVDGEDTIVVADRKNHRLRKIVGGQVTTLAVSSKSVTADGAGTVACFNGPNRLALDERGSVLVAEFGGCEGRKDTLRVVEASLAPSLWMGPVEEVVQDSKVLMSMTAGFAEFQQDYGKLVEDGTLTDIVLVVEGERFPEHRVVLVERSEYFWSLFLSGM